MLDLRWELQRVDEDTALVGQLVIDPLLAVRRSGQDVGEGPFDRVESLVLLDIDEDRADDSVSPAAESVAADLAFSVNLRMKVQTKKMTSSDPSLTLDHNHSLELLLLVMPG